MVGALSSSSPIVEACDVTPAGSEAELVRRMLFETEPEAFDRLEEAAFTAILQTRRLLHVHSERIFLVGCGEGAAVAYWLGLSFPERFAGVVAINGWLPVGLRPLGRLKACRDLPVLVVHGAWNAKVPLHDARKDVATLRAGGLRVAFQSYPCSHRLTNPMLADVDTLADRPLHGRPAHEVRRMNDEIELSEPATRN